MFKKKLNLAMVLLPLALVGCVSTDGPGLGGMLSTGSSPTVASGAAGSTSADANSNLERCKAPLGTIAMDDGRDKEWFTTFGSATKVTSIEPLLRLAVQQSNCFVITAIGNSHTDGHISAITDKQRNSVEFRAGSKQQKGPRVAADYFLEPAIIIDNDSTGKIAGALGSLIGNGVGALAGSLESKVSVATLSLYDIRSSLQIGIAEGNATATNYGAALGAFGGGAAGGLGGFSRTPEGKATVAAFVDAYNKMVVSLRHYKAQEVEGGLGTGGKLKVGK
ncbi:hypothetical protein [Methylobacillus flagellatus]|uniref:Curli production assembly/transport component CsgG n=1 Tax=Methylobacillus flagellatus (strain ATCC 51484 / DSM 6875 / VKM B-1610 / KT) TaxID=265072 RepID=Q1H0J9_METFK|nr:hypothetical protein [Methylobacillus flagellatus]ABE49988.1 conserved hypothetical protein [Methylobacillus flagellatus KT]